MHNKTLKNGLYFVPLGGCEEIGRNLNLFGSVKDGKEQWIVADVGISVEKNPYGTTLHMPMFDYALDKNIIGVICTHGHEDHIGGLPVMMPRLCKALGRDIPIFATKFTLGLILRKYEEYNIKGKFVEVFPNTPFEVGDFTATMRYITHSIPESNMVEIYSKSNDYRIVHTGDWKLDKDPVLGLPTNEEEIKKIGDKGVDALICDSTNAMEKNHTPSEGEVQVAIDNVIKGNTGRRIVISCFSSNIARIDSICKVAKKYNRKVVLFGRSLIKMVEVATETGHLDKNMKIFKPNDFPSLKVEETIIVCTGSQGEKGSVLYRLAHGFKPPFNIKPKDLIIFSARKIPGNEKEIMEMQSLFIRKEAEVFDNSTEMIHVSGHPSAPEVSRMIELLRPKSFIPVHGQAMNFVAMLKIAEKNNIEKRLMPFNGAIIDLLKNKVIDSVESGIVAMDGCQLINLNSQVIRTRKLLAENGVIFISIIPGEKPSICTYGVLEDINQNDCLRLIANSVLNDIAGYKNINQKKEMIQQIISNVNALIKNKFGKNPLISVHILSRNSNLIKNN